MEICSGLWPFFDLIVVYWARLGRLELYRELNAVFVFSKQVPLDLVVLETSISGLVADLCVDCCLNLASN